MKYSTVLIAVVSGLALETLANVLVPRRDCPCYTATQYIADPGCPPFTVPQSCIHPNCATLSTTTIPGPNYACPTTPTITSNLPCQTACQVGCETLTTTETLASACRACPTVTTTRPIFCPLETFQCATPDCVVRSTTDVPCGPVAGCPTTPTVTTYGTCPTACYAGCRTEVVTQTVDPW